MRSPLFAISLTAITFIYQVSAAPLLLKEKVLPASTLAYDFNAKNWQPESAGRSDLRVAREVPREVAQEIKEEIEPSLGVVYDLLLKGVETREGNDLVQISKTDDMSKFTSITVGNISCDVDSKEQQGVSIPIMTCKDKLNNDALVMQTKVKPTVAGSKGDRSEEDIVNGSLLVKIHPATKTDQSAYKVVMASFIKSWNERERPATDA